ncbi:MAG: cryptochrome/photolyase family protein [Acidimicrobiia bacterium]
MVGVQRHLRPRHLIVGSSPALQSIWVLGDQLNRRLGPLDHATPADARILMVESTAKLRSKPWHRQRAHLVITAMRRFAAELTAEGFEVDYRTADSLESGYRAHCDAFDPPKVVAMAPASWDGRQLLTHLGVDTVASNQFLCDPDEYRAWAAGKKRVKMEDFYRWQRQRLGYLMDGDEPAGGRWNFDAENREPPPRDGGSWPEPLRTPLDDLDHVVLSELPDTCWGDPPDGTWATSRAEALRRLDYAVDEILPLFGPHEDAMLSTNWHLAHTLLSPYLNLGLLLPDEVCDRAEVAYRGGSVPIASAEGFIRQIIGWREYVWCRYWEWMPDYRRENQLDAHRALPPVLQGSTTQMRCVEHVMRDLTRYGWTHHIQRLMILGNLALLSGVDPWLMTEWMWSGFVDGAEWVMLPNVVGMALHADGGRMATKPYAAGGAYIDRMSDYCKECRFDRKQRVGDDACPFTTLYWSFLDRHREPFLRNARVAQQVRAADRLSDLDAVRARADTVLAMLDAGTL